MGVLGTAIGLIASIFLILLQNSIPIIFVLWQILTGHHCRTYLAIPRKTGIKLFLALS